MDPFVDLIRLLRPRATLWGGGIEGRGRWGVSFRQRDDLLFCWVVRGECLLIRPKAEPLRLRAEDFVLVRTTEPFTLASGLDAVVADSETAVAATRNTGMRLGDGGEHTEAADVVLHGGRFVFDTANEALLTGLLPALVNVAATDTWSWRVRSLLAMNEAESRQPGPGAEFIVGRLMELMLVETLRNAAQRPQGAPPAGLLAGLADAATARALVAMHEQVARAWTVDELARLACVSRSTLAARFRRAVGLGPIEYLAQWRIALAKDALRQGQQRIGDIALAIGFRSSSAFSTAFTRAVGCPPSQFAAAMEAAKAGKTQGAPEPSPAPQSVQLAR